MSELAPQSRGEWTDLWLVRLVMWLARLLRPWSGWAVLATCALLLALPAPMLAANRWIRANDGQWMLSAIGVVSVLFSWWIGGWRALPTASRWRFLRIAIRSCVVIGAGVLLISVIQARWLPGLDQLREAATTRHWAPVAAGIVDDLARVWARYELWWQGVQSTGAARDDLVFNGIAGLIIWLTGALTVAAVRTTRQGLFGAMPAVLLLSQIFFVGGDGRQIFVLSLALTVLLHLFFHQQKLLARWESQRIDFSPDVFPEHLLNASGVAILALTLAAIIPNWYIRPLAVRWAEVIAPMNERIDAAREQVFPNLERTFQLNLEGISLGLPNRFLLGGGPELSETVVMEVRTSDDGDPNDPAPGHYMRAGTLALYTGAGWDNPGPRLSTQWPANTPRTGISDRGRRILIQSVRVSLPTRVVFAAPEIVEFSADAWVDQFENGELVSVGARDQSYTVVSAVMATAEEDLLALPDWRLPPALLTTLAADVPTALTATEAITAGTAATGATELPLSYAIYLQLPDTVTPATRELARRLTANAVGPYAKAQAIESYLREFPYDLDVDAPPESVTDVADYFLFDLGRGYCDYYATAFVVLARLAGLPTRFATGYAVGGWDPYRMTRTVTAAEAHSWPEVYLPQVGWVVFEPTAGRPALVRQGESQPLQFSGANLPVAPAIPDAPGIDWNWQMLFWLGPLALGVWGIVIGVRRWRFATEDPWLSILRWGKRTGRPLQQGETVLEYGHALADEVEATAPESEEKRIVVRSVVALSEAVNSVHYSPPAERPGAANSAMVIWRQLRSYLATVRRKGKSA